MSEHEMKCPECGGSLEVGKLCPNCLLKMALQPTERIDVELDDLSIPAETTGLSQNGNSKNQELNIEVVRNAFAQLEIIECVGSGGMGTVFFDSKVPRSETTTSTNSTPHDDANGHCKERSLLTGIGEIEIQQPRVRDKRDENEREKFTLKILPPYLRKAKTLEEFIPMEFDLGSARNFLNPPEQVAVEFA